MGTGVTKPSERHIGAEELDGRRSAGFTPPVASIPGARFDQVPPQEQTDLPIAKCQIAREKQTQQTMDDVEVASEAVTSTNAENRQQRDRQPRKLSGRHPNWDSCVLWSGAVRLGLHSPTA